MPVPATVPLAASTPTAVEDNSPVPCGPVTVTAPVGAIDRSGAAREGRVTGNPQLPIVAISLKVILRNIIVVVCVKCGRRKGYFLEHIMTRQLPSL